MCSRLSGPEPQRTKASLQASTTTDSSAWLWGAMGPLSALYRQKLTVIFSLATALLRPTAFCTTRPGSSFFRISSLLTKSMCFPPYIFQRFRLTGTVLPFPGSNRQKEWESP